MAQHSRQQRRSWGGWLVSMARRFAIRALGLQDVQARREAAMTTAENKGQWENTDGLSPNAALDPGTRSIVRNRARYEATNDSYCSGMLETLADDTIGDGPILQVQGASQADNTFVENEFAAWMTAVGLVDKLWTMRYAKACDGESFGSMFTNPRLRTPVKLDVKLHEAEQIADPALGMNGWTETDGINLDTFGNVASYSLLLEHPGSLMSLGVLKSVDVPAAAMLHIAHTTRPGQVRGTPEIEPSLHTFSRRRSYLKAVGTSAESAASINWFVETDNPPGEESDPDDGPDDFEVLETVRGKGLVLPAKAKLSQLKAEQPTSTADMFCRILIAEQARCIGQPYNIAANDSSGYNFSSANLDHRQYFRKINRQRAVILEPKVLDRLFEEWWNEARLIANYLPESIRQALPAHVWRWNSQNLNDPLKEAQASQIRLQTPGLTTLAAEAAKDGTDWEQNLRQNAREQQLKRDLGLLPTAQPADALTAENQDDDNNPDDESDQDDAEEGADDDA